MEYRKLGKCGLKLSALSFGSWVTFGSQVSQHVAKELISMAHDNGINFYDNAEVYCAGESEVIMGNAIHELSIPRDRYCISSKVFWGGDAPTQNGLSRKHVFEACHAALKRLRVDYLDLYFCHRPDPETPIEETVWAMHSLVQQGKILYWGTSEWPVESILHACLFARENHLIGPSMEQPQYNLFKRDKLEYEYLPLFKEFGYGTTTWSPLASGILTGKYNEIIPEDSRANLQGYEWLKERLNSDDGQRKLIIVNELTELAQQLNCTVSQLAIAWCLKNPNVSTVILGASKLAQLEENIGAYQVYNRLDQFTMEHIENIVAKNLVCAPLASSVAAKDNLE